MSLHRHRSNGQAAVLPIGDLKQQNCAILPVAAATEKVKPALEASQSPLTENKLQ